MSDIADVTSKLEMLQVSESYIEDARSLLNGTDDIDIDNFFNIFLTAWDKLSKDETVFNSMKMKKLPLMFRSTKIIEVVKKCLTPVFIWRRHRIDSRSYPFSVASGSSSLIIGPVGVGKTTIMLVLHRLLSILMDDVISVFHEFRTQIVSDPLPLNLVRLEVGVKDSSATLSSLLEGGKMLVFFGDEIQKCYKPRSCDASERKHAVSIVAELALLGKHNDSIGIIAGSSVHTQDYVLYPNSFGFDDYESLNNSVYTPIAMHPLRSKDEFQHLCRHLYSGTNFTDVMLRDMFKLTGGVGRLLLSHAIPPSAERTAELVSSTIMQIPKLYHSDGVLRAIIHEMISTVGNVVLESHFDPWEHPHRMSGRRIRAILKVHCIDHADVECVFTVLCYATISNVV